MPTSLTNSVHLNLTRARSNSFWVASRLLARKNSRATWFPTPLDPECTTPAQAHHTKMASLSKAPMETPDKDKTNTCCSATKTQSRFLIGGPQGAPVQAGQGAQHYGARGGRDPGGVWAVCRAHGGREGGRDSNGRCAAGYGVRLFPSPRFLSSPISLRPFLTSLLHLLGLAN
jgi:hypothetical protein